uniref:NHL repeat-containing protein 2-like n=1 Tax=Myxine glutinosa TaxID=7769 RepID=UPI00358EB447
MLNCWTGPVKFKLDPQLTESCNDGAKWRKLLIRLSKIANPFERVCYQVTLLLLFFLLFFLDGLVVIGVHSAKFPHEKVTDGVLAAVQRYNIEHPVVCDGEAQLWQALGVSCWPTVLLLGPRANPLFAFVGEGQGATLSLAVAAALRYYREKGEINDSPVGLAPFKGPLSSSMLRFPGKICLLDEEEGQPAGLVIADTGNHRVLVIDTTGQVLHCVGGRLRGYSDGTFSKARFNMPQGVCSLGKKIFVADTENHLIRQIDLQNGLVSTLVGTGVQSRDFEGGNVGPKQPISSPWDVAIGCSA